MERHDQHLEEAWKTILERARTVETFTSGLSLVKFKANTRANYATVYCLELVADASLELSSQSRSRHPDVPWYDFVEEAEFYRRHYDRVSLDNVWGTVHEKLPILVAAAEAELGRVPDR